MAGFTVILVGPASRGKTYAFGDPRVYTFKELIEFVRAVINTRPLLVPLPFWVAEGLGGVLQVFPMRRSPAARFGC